MFEHCQLHAAPPSPYTFLNSMLPPPPIGAVMAALLPGQGPVGALCRSNSGGDAAAVAAPPPILSRSVSGPSCSVCFEAFEGKHFRVALGPCGHTSMCAVCASSIFRAADPASEFVLIAKVDGARPECVECRRGVSIYMRIFL